MPLLNVTRRRALEATLLSISVFATAGGRDRLLADLPPGLVQTVPRSDSPALDIAAIVEACNSWITAEAEAVSPVRLLIDNALAFAADSQVGEQLAALRDALAAETNPPVAPPTPPGHPRLPQVRQTAEELLACVNELLAKNQAILVPFLKDPSTRQAAYSALFDLYEAQGNRADFGRWRAVLEAAGTDESDPALHMSAAKLLDTFNALDHVFHDFVDHFEPKRLQTRGLVVSALDSTSGMDDNAVRAFTRKYIQRLRGLVEDLGQSVGELQALL